MRNVFKQIGIIALVAIIGFSMVSCDTDTDKGGGGEQILTISGTFGGAFIAGESYPVNLIVHFDWDSTSVYMEEAGEWSIERLPFDKDVILWFEIRILTDGTSEDVTKSINYQLSSWYKIKNQSKNNIKIPKIDIPSLITLSGTADTTLQGTWNRTEKHTNVQAINKSITTDPFASNGHLKFDAGWTYAHTRVAEDHSWELSIPSSTNETNISFNVALEGTKISEQLWEMGQKTGLNPITVTNQDMTEIDLGTIPFVMVSGNTTVTVNGERPYAYWIEFGYYWDEDEDVVINGWSGSTMTFLEGMGTAWSVPMPANTKLVPEIYYREKSSIQFRKNKVLESSFNTGTGPYTLNLNSISNITN